MRTPSHAALAALFAGGCSLLVGRIGARPCEEGAPPRCDGNDLVICDQGVERVTACGELVCDAGAASCDPCGNDIVEPGTLCFDEAVALTVEANPVGVFAGDIDGDLDVDLAAA